MAKKEKKSEKGLTVKRKSPVWYDFDQLFDDFRDNFNSLFWGPRTMSFPSWTDLTLPSTDIIDHGDHYEVDVDLPGVPKDNIDIEVTSHSIEISANYEEHEKEEEDKNWLRRERSLSYQRYLDLPEEIKSENVDAELNTGVLNIRLPKSTPKPKISSKKVKIK